MLDNEDKDPAARIKSTLLHFAARPTLPTLHRCSVTLLVKTIFSRGMGAKSKRLPTCVLAQLFCGWCTLAADIKHWMCADHMISLGHVFGIPLNNLILSGNS